MGKYIDADLLIKDIQEKFICLWDSNLTLNLKNTIEAQPEADVRENIHGKWTLLPSGNAVCSHCGFLQMHAWDEDNYDHYCHHCGAEMELSEE